MDGPVCICACLCLCVRVSVQVDRGKDKPNNFGTADFTSSNSDSR